MSVTGNWTIQRKYKKGWDPAPLRRCGSLFFRASEYDMKNIREYGIGPFSVAVIHGGPGASGDMAPVAKELALVCGILEPLQTSTSLEGQLQELHTSLKKHADLPITLIGHSWGAWLSFLFAARYPSYVKKLILIGSGVFEKKYALTIMATRLNRLNDADKLNVHSLKHALNDSHLENKDEVMAQFGKLMAQADSFDPIPFDNDELDAQYGIYHCVWQEAEDLRERGKLLEQGKKIQCPVVAIHGDYDSSPPEGIEEPLSKILKDFRFIILKNCGHYPWIERTAKDNFYEIIKTELK
ncbi:Pimeloyl-ACP methyl ester carboxylesterase [Methanophagales archaeon]|nr:Pimeloyl-ACP methyl ester carboxylesterase [Methanophagales archaeon]